MTQSSAPAGAAAEPNYNRTMIACFVGYITQAVINNYMPLLFVTFAATLGIDMARLSALITVNFVTQLVVDVLAGRFVDRIGYKPCIIAAHVSAAAGLLVLGLVPTRVSDPYWAILVAILLYALGGGLIEVMVSPIVEACPSEHKAKAMSLLHSFYCWGQLGTVVISTLFLWAFGMGTWPVLACLWAIVPLVGIVMFWSAPMPRVVPEGVATMRLRDLAAKPVFYLLFVMMLCAGAAEQGMSQWASTFAETGLGVTKVVGDLAGPAAFALMMGLSRTIYGMMGHKLNLRAFIAGSSMLCVATYLTAALTTSPVLGLVACALTGFSVGIMWPGTFSLGADAMPGGGTLMFALFAVAGDLGCAGGPAVVGFIAAANGNNLKAGLLFGSIFAVILLVCVLIVRRVDVVAPSSRG
ncbi:fucose permease [Bifidobacterium lemurum]|uniref:Fucose permease n=1 Tax=Bifidobacterium lemurum TaxID=1603886 RepID=A0A261FVI2_9BIFI|nr:MFS transporter [Bifidobacterium lemurum]OZG62776.1 fucose permease [Bifidobacterium lemurum]QOL34515.1 MFS transporter [Bifidobacterium lemurum]